MLIQKEELAQHINRLKSIVPKKTSFSALQGILVRDSFMTASNMELTVKIRIKNDEKEEFLIPVKAFDLISSLPDGEVNITLQKAGHILIRTGKIKNKCQTIILHNKSNAAFITEDCEIYTRIAGLEYYKYAPMFADLPFHTTTSKEEFLDAVIRARTCADVSPVQLAISGKEMNINVKNSTTDYHEVIALQENVDEPLTIGFNAGLIINTLKAFEGKNVKIHLADAKKPMIMEAEECGFKALVLPIFQRG